jgi:hypothetical protein
MFSNLCWRPFYATNSRRVTATLTTNEEHGLCPTSGLITARPGLLQKIIGTLSRDEASGQRAKLFDYAEAEAARCRHNHATEGSEGQDEVTDEPHLPRFIVRRGAGRGWMVWDRHTKGPAKYLGNLVVGLAEEQAREIADALTKQYIAKG